MVCVCDEVCDDVSVQVYGGGDDDGDDDGDVNCDKQDNIQCLMMTHTHIYQDKPLYNYSTQHILILDKQNILTFSYNYFFIY